MHFPDVKLHLPLAVPFATGAQFCGHSFKPHVGPLHPCSHLHVWGVVQLSEWWTQASELMQRPCLLQSSGQSKRSHAFPTNPGLQTQVPLLHCPCFAHPASQLIILHETPSHPEKHWQAQFLHSPWPKQSPGHFCSLQSSPV